jgi:hypothetical protein
MDWLRSEDLKEEEKVTAPIVIMAVHAPGRFPVCSHTLRI